MYNAGWDKILRKMMFNMVFLPGMSIRVLFLLFFFFSILDSGFFFSSLFLTTHHPPLSTLLSFQRFPGNIFATIRALEIDHFDCLICPVLRFGDIRAQRGYT